MENGNNSSSTVNVTEDIKWNFTFSTVMATVFSITSFLAVGGNLMVITVVARHPGMRTRTNLFLVNLAVADFLVGCLALPLALVTLINNDWIFGDILCTIDGFINCFCLIASIHTLMYISIHKYFSITRPYYPLKLHRIVLMMAAAWFWAGFCATITVTGLTHVEYKKGTSQCGPAYPNDVLSYIHHAIIQVSNILIPLSIMIFCYVKMFRKIRSHGQRMHQNTTLEEDVIMSQQKRVFVTLFIVLACFILFWLPYHIYATYLVTSRTTHLTKVSSYFNPLAYMFGYMNSACNPIIYAFRSPSFRAGYKEILCRTSAYLISDETILDEDASPTRRLSDYFTFGSLKKSSSVHDVPRKISLSSPSTAEINSPGFGPKMNFRRGKSITELMRALPKTCKGSSIIRRDGSLVIMKAGKIVSVREAKNFTNGLPPVFRCKLDSGSNHTLNRDYKEDLYNESIEEYEMDILLRNSDREHGMEEISDNSNESSDNSNTEDKTLTGRKSSDNINLPDIMFTFSPDRSGTNNFTGEDESEDYMVLSTMPLTPNTKRSLAKSDQCLDVDCETDRKSSKHKARKLSNGLKATKSFSGLHCLRNLEVASVLEKSKSSSEKILNLMGSPLLLRRLEKRQSSLALLENQIDDT